MSLIIALRDTGPGDGTQNTRSPLRNRGLRKSPGLRLNDAAAAARCRRDGFGAGVAQIDAQAPDAAADAHGGLPGRGGGGGAPQGRRRHPVRSHHLPMSSCRFRGVDGSGVAVGRFNDTLCHGSAARLNEGERRILCFRAIPALPRKLLPACANRPSVSHLTCLFRPPGEVPLPHPLTPALAVVLQATCPRSGRRTAGATSPPPSSWHGSRHGSDRS